MRGLGAAIAALALMVQPIASAKPARPAPIAPRLADAAMLDRAAIDCQRAAVIVSLWPSARRQCAIAPVYAIATKAAELGAVRRLSGDARAQQASLAARFSAAAPPQISKTERRRAA